MQEFEKHNTLSFKSNTAGEMKRIADVQLCGANPERVWILPNCCKLRMLALGRQTSSKRTTNTALAATIT